MPRYDYKCVDCQDTFELVQTFAEAGKATCPSCSGAGRRLFHAVPVIYKGSGFYTTDYGRPKRPAESSEKDSESKASTNDSSSSSSGSSSSSNGSSDSGSSGNGSSDSGSSDSKSDSTSKASTEATSSN